MASRADVQLTFNEVEVTGLAVEFRNLLATSERLSAPLTFEQVELSPTWGTLLGDDAANVILNWRGLKAAATVYQTDKQIFLKSIHAETSGRELFKMIEPLLHLPIAIDAFGVVSMDGNLVLDSSLGTVESGTLNIYWKGAKAGVMGVEFPLGDLLFRLQSEAARWNWSVQDGVGFIDAKGVVKRQSGEMGHWPVEGNILVNIAKMDGPTLLAWKPENSADEIRLSVSGRLSSPGLSVIK